MAAPSSSGRGAVTFLPATKVPLLLSKSSIVTPSVETAILA